MDNEELAPATLRDEISANFDALVPADTPPTAPSPAAAVDGAPPAAESAEQKAGRLAGRQRGPDGKLLPGKAAKPEAGPQAQPSATPSAGEVPPTPAVPAAPKVARPSSWKKDHWEAFDKLTTENPALAQYINQREQEFSRGVSTYKQEWETAKPLLDAVAPFMQVMAQHNVQPAQMVHNLMSAHQALALGNPQAKMEMAQRILADYGIPAQLAVQNQAGEWQLLAAAPPRQQQQPQQPQQQDVRKTVQEILLEERAAQQIQEFTGNTEQHPHYEEVRGTMQGLLQAGLANTLEEAYEAALRHPRHADLYEAQQSQQREADEKQRREAAQALADKARRQTISPRTASPGSPAAKSDAKDLRREIEANFDAATASRV